MSAVSTGDASWWVLTTCLGAAVGLVVGVLMQSVTALVLNQLAATRPEVVGPAVALSARAGPVGAAVRRPGHRHNHTLPRTVAACLPVVAAAATATLLVRAWDLDQPQAVAGVVAAAAVTAVISMRTAAWVVGR